MKTWWTKYQKILLGLFTSFAVLCSLVVIVPSGSYRCEQAERCGDFFYGAHEHDGIWHLAVAETLKTQTEWQMPTYAGASLSGYNYGIDALTAGLAKLTNISVKDWYFRGLPLLWAGLYSLGLLYFAKGYSKHASYPWLVVLFGFFGSSLSFLLTLYHQGSIWGSSTTLSMQQLAVMTNPQLGLSLAALIWYCGLWIKNEKPRSWSYLGYGVLGAIALGMKFYTGVIMLVMMLANFWWEMRRETNSRKIVLGRHHLMMAIPILGVGLWLYPPGRGEFPLIFEPFATVRPIIEEAQLFYLPRVANMLYHPSPIVRFGAELIAWGIFVLMNYGLRLVGLVGITDKGQGRVGQMRRVMMLGAVVGLALTTLLVQRGIWWNTIQFVYVSFFLTGLLAAEVISKWLAKRNISLALKVGVIFGLSLATLPNTLDTLRIFTSKAASSYVSQSELEALAYLKTRPNGVVFYPVWHGDNPEQKSALLSRRHDTAFVSAYSGKVVYLANKTQLELLNIPYAERWQKVESYDCQVLEEVTYLYEESWNQYLQNFEKCGRPMEQIYQNEAVKLYRVGN